MKKRKQDQPSLSLQERVHLATKSLNKLGIQSFWTIVGVLALTSMILVTLYYTNQEFAKYGEIVTIQVKEGGQDTSKTIFVPHQNNFQSKDLLNVLADHYESIRNLAIVIALISGGLLAWLVIRGLKTLDTVEEWDQDYLSQAYILNFETSKPEGRTTAEKIFNHAKLVFPELKLLKKTKNKTEKQIIAQGIDYDIKGYKLDLALETKEGYFIGKHFQDHEVTLEDMKELTKKVYAKFSTHVVRILVFAKSFDKSFLEKDSLEEQMDKLATDYAIDLIIDHGTTYSVLWID